MKRIQTKTTIALLIAAASIAPVYGQHRGEGQGRYGSGGTQQQDQQHGRNREQQSRPPEFRQQATPQQDWRSGNSQYRQQPQQTQQTQRSDSWQRGYQQPRAYQQQQSFEQQPQSRQQSNYRGGNSFRQSYSGSWQNDRQSWSQRGGYRGYFIPQNRFYSSFGRQNYFRIGRPVFYNGYPRFQYGGYSFRIVDPWPAYWGDNWYDSDDVYIDYQDDGYYMYNRQYPGAGVSIDVEF